MTAVRSFVSDQHEIIKRASVDARFCYDHIHRDIVDICYDLIETDPYHSSVVLANLGSIGLPDGYHHLTNWGTTSMFVVIGQSGKMPFFENEQVVFKDGVKLGFTVDERIADGYYFSKSIKMLKLFLEQPELLDLPLNEINMK